MMSPPDRRVVHPRGDADLVLDAACSGWTFGRPSSRRHLAGVERRALDLAGCEAPRHLAGQPADLALELPHARLARVAGDRRGERLVGHHELAVREPRLGELPREQEAAGDLELLLLGVAGELHDLHAVEERPRDVLDEVGGRDEQHLGEVERHAEVVVGEGVVLRRVEHLEQRRRRVALVRDAELVHLVEEEDGVRRAGLLHPLDDAARHGADVGAPVAADVGLVAHAAERDAHVLAPHRARRSTRATEVLPTPGGPTNSMIGARPLVVGCPAAGAPAVRRFALPAQLRARRGTRGPGPSRPRGRSDPPRAPAPRARGRASPSLRLPHGSSAIVSR